MLKLVQKKFCASGPYTGKMSAKSRNGVSTACHAIAEVKPQAGALLGFRCRKYLLNCRKAKLDCSHMWFPCPPCMENSVRLQPLVWFSFQDAFLMASLRLVLRTCGSCWLYRSAEIKMPLEAASTVCRHRFHPSSMLREIKAFGLKGDLEILGV